MARPSSRGLRRRLVSLLTAFTFVVMAVSGVLAFFQPFSIKLVGLHALMGFVFLLFVGAHVVNNAGHLKAYLTRRSVWLALAVSAVLTALFYLQPASVKSLLGLSQNLGPALDRFELSGDGMVYQYAPSPDYKMELTVRAGPAYDFDDPPRVAIWLENQGGYHIKTLRHPEDGAGELPYWKFKREGWQKAKEEAEKDSQAEADLDAVSSPTPNGSFDPADYILPADPENSTPYQLLLEINEPGDAHGESADQPSLVYSVEIDNLNPRIYQLLDLVGFPKREDEDGEEAWSLYFVDDRIGSAVGLVDSALLRIELGEAK